MTHVHGRAKNEGTKEMLRTTCRYLGLVMLVLAAPARAHHSFAMFDQTKTLTLQGTVRQFQWTNPHCFIQLLVDSADGPVEWSLEMHSPLASQRRGWKRDTLKPGDAVTVVINPLRDGMPGGMVVQATDPRGRVFHNMTVQP
jgi:hypothetical protein